MSNRDDFELPNPQTAPELFEDILKRRVVAYFIDLMVLTFIGTMVLLVGVVAGFLTLGLSWIGLVIAMPLSIVIYYAVTLGSEKRSTVGMGMMDLVLTPVRGGPLDGWRAFAHPLVFWLTVWILAPISMVFALFTPRRQMIHDYIMGTLMVRRSPMERHWNAATGH